MTSITGKVTIIRLPGFRRNITAERLIQRGEIFVPIEFSQRRDHRDAARRRGAAEDQPLGHRGHLGPADNDRRGVGLRLAAGGRQARQDQQRGENSGWLVDGPALGCLG